MNKSFCTLFAVIFAFCSTPAIAEEVKKIEPASVITLPVETKDPFTAYSLGLIPFSSYSAANYVGTTRLSWQPSAGLRMAAFFQNTVDIALFISAITCFQRASQAVNQTTGCSVYGINQTDSSLAYYSYLTGYLASVIAIPVSRLLWHAPYWGNAAVEQNKRVLLENGYKVAP
ncbi:MAG: hypothetical protein ACM3YO_02320 [Bacteroidota bacterium]